jgi:hypothetical protein
MRGDLQVSEANVPVVVDIKVKKHVNGMWRADLTGHSQQEILFFYDKTPVGAASKAIEYLKEIGEVMRTEIIMKGAN